MVTDTKSSSDDFLLGLILRSMWQGRGILTLCLAFGFSVAILYISLVKPSFRAVALIAPISSNNAMGRAQGAFAAISGLSMGSDSDTNFNQYLLVLHSATLAEHLASHNGLDKELLGGWDPKTQQWRQPSVVTATIRQLLGRHRPATPTATRFAEYLSSEVVTTMLNSGGAAMMQSRIYQVSFDYKNAVAAERILATILHEADYIMRKGQLLTTQSRIAYLREQLKTTTDIPLRDALQSVLASEQQNLMSEKADEYYSIKILDKPHADNTPYSPRTYLVIGLAAVMSLLVGATINMFLLWRRFVRAENTGMPIFSEPFPNPLRPIKALFERRRMPHNRSTP